MIHDLNPYPAMKDSGVPWLGQVPEHWAIKRLGSVLKERGEVNKNRQVTEVLSVMKDVGVIPYADKGNVGNKKSDDIERYKIVRPDDLVVNSMNVIIGSVGRSKYTGCLSQVYYVLERRQIENDPRYIELIFKNRAVQHSLTRIGNGILAHRMRIPMELLKSEPFLLPPPDEQAAIVRFLDHADRRIRKAIAAKQKLIRLLQEQKQVVIHQAVTRGLDPNVRLKPSGVEWLGDVPEGWKVTRLKQVATVQTGLTLGKNYGDNRTVEYPYLRVANVQAGRLNLAQVKTIQVPEQEAARSRLQRGDVLMTEGGDIDKLGRGCVWNAEITECLHQNHVFAVRPKSTELEPEFLARTMSSAHGRRYFELTAKQTTNLASTNSTTLGNLPLALPSIPEQQAILEYICQESEPLEQAEQRAQQEISLLREYRTRLIADVVTGKLDVREAAVQLPEPTDEAVPEELEADVEGELETDDAEAEVVEA